MKLQLKNLTWSDFDQHKPCYSPKEKYGDFTGTILDLLKDERIPDSDKIWAFTREGIMDDRTLRLFAVRCARKVQHLMTDPRSINALDVAENYANGLASDEDLAAAWEAAWEEAREARAEAWAAAMAAASEAAREAAREARAAAWEAAREAAMVAASEAAREAAMVAASVAASEAARVAASVAARAAAWSVAMVAASVAASEAAREAAGVAAWEAERKKQVQIAIDLTNEFYEEPKPKNKFIKSRGLIKKLITFVESINLSKLWQQK